MRLLIADPDVVFRNRLRQAARGLGTVEYVDAASSLAEARAAQAENAYDILLVDDASPDFAAQTLSDLCRQRPTTAVVVVGGDDPETLRAAMQQGARGYLRRGEALDSLGGAVEVLGRGGIYVPPLLGMGPANGMLMTSAGPVPAGFFRNDANEHLTPRQRQVLAMIRDDWSNSDIAEALDLKIGTVKIHITAIFKALGVRNRTQAKVAAQCLDLPDLSIGNVERP